MEEILEDDSVEDVEMSALPDVPDIPLSAEGNTSSLHKIFRIMSIPEEEDYMFCHERIMRERERLDRANKKLQEVKEKFGPKIEILLSDDDDDDVDDEKHTDVSQQVEVRRRDSSFHPTLHVFLNDDLTCCVFDHWTLTPHYFFPEDELPLELKSFVETRTLVDFIKKSLSKTSTLGLEDRKGFCRFLFFLMTVHPNQTVVESALSYLMYCRDYQPAYMDILTVFMNWGALREELYRDKRAILWQLPEVVQLIGPPIKRTVDLFCIRKTIEYIKYIFMIGMMEEYFPLLEPMLRFSMDRRIYEAMWGEMHPVILQLSANWNYSVENLHFKEWNLSAQACVCRKLLRTSPLSVPLAYATLQHYVGVREEDIVYSREVTIEDMIDIFSDNVTVICKATYVDMEILLDLLFFPAEEMGLLHPNHVPSEQGKKLIERLNDVLVSINTTLSAYGRTEYPIVFRELISRKSCAVNSHRTFFSLPWQIRYGATGAA